MGNDKKISSKQVSFWDFTVLKRGKKGTILFFYLQSSPENSFFKRKKYVLFYEVFSRTNSVILLDPCEHNKYEGI